MLQAQHARDPADSRRHRPGNDRDLARFCVRWLRYSEGIDKPIVQPQFPMFFDLGSDPGEHDNLFNTRLDMGWMYAIATQAAGEFERSVAQYPNIKPGEEFTG